MASIEIKNVSKVISSAETLASGTVKLDSARESIDYILNELNQYWAETQQDAQTFAEGLKKNVERIQTMVECNKEFATAITNYAEAQQKTSTSAITIE